MCTRMHACVCVYMCVSVHVCACMHMCMHIISVCASICVRAHVGLHFTYFAASNGKIAMRQFLCFPQGKPEKTGLCYLAN